MSTLDHFRPKTRSSRLGLALAGSSLALLAACNRASDDVRPTPVRTTSSATPTPLATVAVVSAARPGSVTADTHPYVRPPSPSSIPLSPEQLAQRSGVPLEVAQRAFFWANWLATPGIGPGLFIALADRQTGFTTNYEHHDVVTYQGIYALPDNWQPEFRIAPDCNTVFNPFDVDHAMGAIAQSIAATNHVPKTDVINPGIIVGRLGLASITEVDAVVVDARQWDAAAGYADRDGFTNFPVLTRSSGALQVDQCIRVNLLNPLALSPLTRSN